MDNKLQFTVVERIGTIVPQAWLGGNSQGMVFDCYLGVIFFYEFVSLWESFQEQEAGTVRLSIHVENSIAGQTHSLRLRLRDVYMLFHLRLLSHELK